MIAVTESILEIDTQESYSSIGFHILREIVESLDI